MYNDTLGAERKNCCGSVLKSTLPMCFRERQIVEERLAAKCYIPKEEGLTHAIMQPQAMNTID